MHACASPCNCCHMSKHNFGFAGVSNVIESSVFLFEIKIVVMGLIWVFPFWKLDFIYAYFWCNLFICRHKVFVGSDLNNGLNRCIKVGTSNSIFLLVDFGLLHVSFLGIFGCWCLMSCYFGFQEILFILQLIPWEKWVFLKKKSLSVNHIIVKVLSNKTIKASK